MKAESHDHHISPLFDPKPDVAGLANGAIPQKLWEKTSFGLQLFERINSLSPLEVEGIMRRKIHEKISAPWTGELVDAIIPAAITADRYALGGYTPSDKYCKFNTLVAVLTTALRRNPTLAKTPEELQHFIAPHIEKIPTLDSDSVVGITERVFKTLPPPKAPSQGIFFWRS